MFSLPQYQGLDINGFQNMLSYKNLTNSYKLYWFYAVFHEVCLGNTELKFDTLVLRMITKSWYSITQFKLNFGKLDELGKIVLKIYNDYSLHSNIKEELFEFLLSIKENKDMKRYIKDFCKYVPYRLIRSFYSFKVAKDYEVNSKVEQLSNANDSAIYRISNEKQEIIIHKHWYNYIIKNQTIIEGWLKYKLVYFLQKRNPNTPALLNKLEAPQKRDLKQATEYWKAVMNHTMIIDLYTSLPFTKTNKTQHGNVSLDHFIPWRYVMHDGNLELSTYL